MYITNQIKVNNNTKRVLFSGRDANNFEYTVYAAYCNADNCWVTWLEYNGDPIYIGWFDINGEIELDGRDFEWDDVDFDESYITEKIEDMIAEITSYEECDGDYYEAECHNHETGEDVAMSFKTTQQAYPADNGCYASGYDDVEYIASAIAENGQICVLGWCVPKEIEDLSGFNWEEVHYVDFR